MVLQIPILCRTAGPDHAATETLPTKKPAPRTALAGISK